MIQYCSLAFDNRNKREKARRSREIAGNEARFPEIITERGESGQRSALVRASSSLNERIVPRAYDALCTRDVAAYAVRAHASRLRWTMGRGDGGVRRDVTSGARASSVGTGGRCVRESAREWSGGKEGGREEGSRRISREENPPEAGEGRWKGERVRRAAGGGSRVTRVEGGMR